MTPVPLRRSANPRHAVISGLVLWPTVGSTQRRGVGNVLGFERSELDRFPVCLYWKTWTPALPIK
jgi:hypothetical protein